MAGVVIDFQSLDLEIIINLCNANTINIDHSSVADKLVSLLVCIGAGKDTEVAPLHRNSWRPRQYLENLPREALRKGGVKERARALNGVRSRRILFRLANHDIVMAMAEEHLRVRYRFAVNVSDELSNVHRAPRVVVAHMVRLDLPALDYLLDDRF